MAERLRGSGIAEAQEAAASVNHARGEPGSKSTARGAGRLPAAHRAAEKNQKMATNWCAGRCVGVHAEASNHATSSEAPAACPSLPAHPLATWRRRSAVQKQQKNGIAAMLAAGGHQLQRERQRTERTRGCRCSPLGSTPHGRLPWATCLQVKKVPDATKGNEMRAGTGARRRQAVLQQCERCV